jgi:hypothetical protein
MAVDHVGCMPPGGLGQSTVGVQPPHVAARAQSADLADQRLTCQLRRGLELDVAVGARRPARVGVAGDAGNRHDRSRDTDAHAAPTRSHESATSVVLVRPGGRSADAQDNEHRQQPQCQPPYEEKHHDAVLVARCSRYRNRTQVP